MLVAAESASHSGKAKKAREWRKPILTVTEFRAWADGYEAVGHAPAASGSRHLSVPVELVLTALPPAGNYG